jgi:very-short-patch-repair endonuclease
LHRRLRRSSELDHIAYAATTAPLVSRSFAGEPATAPVAPHVAAPEAAPQVTVSGVVGRPHPSSEAEKRLYLHLTQDDELGALFSYNQPIPTAFDTEPRVDLVWHGGRLVVEIDGADHRKHHRFCDDRVRDYELLLTGFRVLRLVDTEVLMDPKLAVAKIRNVVRFLKRAEIE